MLTITKAFNEVPMTFCHESSMIIFISVGAYFNEEEHRLERLRSHRILVKCYESDRSSTKEELLFIPRMTKRHWHFVKRPFQTLFPPPQIKTEKSSLGTRLESVASSKFICLENMYV